MGVSLTDVWQVLRSGAIQQPAEVNEETGEWKYRMEGSTPDGYWLVIVFGFEEIDRACLVTAWEDEGKRRAG